MESVTADRFHQTYLSYCNSVNGDDADPLWKFLKKEQPGVSTAVSLIKWNFTKFLVDRDGKTVKRYGPKDNPTSIEPDIILALKS